MEELASCVSPASGLKLNIMKSEIIKTNGEWLTELKYLGLTWIPSELVTRNVALYTKYNLPAQCSAEGGYLCRSSRSGKIGYVDLSPIMYLHRNEENFARKQALLEIIGMVWKYNTIWTSNKGYRSPNQFWVVMLTLISLINVLNEVTERNSGILNLEPISYSDLLASPLATISALYNGGTANDGLTKDGKTPDRSGMKEMNKDSLFYSLFKTNALNIPGYNVCNGSSVCANIILKKLEKLPQETNFGVPLDLLTLSRQELRTYLRHGFDLNGNNNYLEVRVNQPNLELIVSRVVEDCEILKIVNNPIEKVSVAK